MSNRRPGRPPRFSSAATERRIARVARQAAKVICQLRRNGEREAAARLQEVACEAVDRMRAGDV